MVESITRIVLILFLMLGPFKILGPYRKLTAAADPKLAKRIAIRAISYSTISLLVAGLIGQNMLNNFGIPVPILALSGGIILFLVALINVIQQFTYHGPVDEKNSPPPTLEMAIFPLAFPTIVTPYGIAAVIVFLSITPEVEEKLAIGSAVLGIMVINLLFMIYQKKLYKVLAFFLPILAAILGVVQVALGLQIIYRSLLKILET